MRGFEKEYFVNKVFGNLLYGMGKDFFCVCEIGIKTIRLINFFVREY